MKAFVYPSLPHLTAPLDRLRCLIDYIPGSGAHAQSVAAATLKLAQALGIRGQELVSIFYGAILHDVGKIALPAEILNKPGLLSDSEWDVIRMHPVYGLGILARFSGFHPAMDIPFSHHERWDGSGYPLGLKGEEIPMFVRICSVADVWDALTQDRPYRKAWSEAQARSYLWHQAGTQFDPVVVEKFLQIVSERNL